MARPHSPFGVRVPEIPVAPSIQDCLLLSKPPERCPSRAVAPSRGAAKARRGWRRSLPFPPITHRLKSNINSSIDILIDLGHVVVGIGYAGFCGEQRTVEFYDHRNVAQWE
jgi:hypothetical protein